MVSVVLSSLFVVLALQSVCSQNLGYPNFGGGFPMLGGINPYTQFGNVLNQHQQQNQDVLTCINSNPQDPSSFIRLTITHHDSFGRGGLLYGQRDDDYTPRDWLINGYYKPSTLKPVSGTFQMLVTQYGRVSDGCNAAAMGPAVSSLDPFGHNFLNPFFPMGGHYGPNSRPAGHLDSPLYVTQGGLTIYSARIQGVSRNQLLGGGIAVCPQVSNTGECYGGVLQCCTIAKDRLPASEVYVTQGQQLGSNVGGFPGGNLGNNYNPVLLGGAGAYGVSVPFEIESGNVLSFTDPNAALAASKDDKSRQQSSAESGSSAGSSSSKGLF